MESLESKIGRAQKDAREAIMDAVKVEPMIMGVEVDLGAMEHENHLYLIIEIVTICFEMGVTRDKEVMKAQKSMIVDVSANYEHVVRDIVADYVILVYVPNMCIPMCNFTC